MIRLILRSATKSLENHILFTWAFASLPMSVLFAVFAYQDHEFTIVRLLRIVTAWSAAGVILALGGWYVIWAPRRRRSGRKED